MWASAYIIADKFDIPLIIQGENAALTLGTALDQEQSDNAFSVVDLNTLKSFKMEDLVIEDEVMEKDLFFYKMPNIERMKRKGIRAVFLQYYAKEWSQVYNADFAIARGLVGRTEDLHELGRYHKYSDTVTILPFSKKDFRARIFATFGLTRIEIISNPSLLKLSRFCLPISVISSGALFTKSGFRPNFSLQ